MGPILAIAEHRDGRIADVSGELIAAATALAPEMDCDVIVGVIGEGVDNDDAAALNKKGVDRIVTVEVGPGSGTDGSVDHAVSVESITSLFSDVRPSVVLMPHTITGIDYAPAVAGRLDIPLMTNAIDLEYDGSLLVTRKLYESKVEATTRMPDAPVAVTLRAGSIEPAEEDGDATVEAFEPDLAAVDTGVRVVGVEHEEVTSTDITQANFIVSVGLGIEDEENVDLIRRLCDATGATLAATRPVAELGWVDKDRQVGQSGKMVKPTVYVAIGISGAIEHVVGMKNSDVIVAINNDPDAPIFDVADYGVVDDLFEIVPALIEAFE